MNNTKVFKIPEVWGGIECTINRVGNEFKDQLAYSGHYERAGDLEKISKLGVRTIRYPVIWEKHQPAKNLPINWNWTDRQLEYIRFLGIKPIVGLLHHGSGPAFTCLLDPEFPYLLAAYAYEVASRYPWLEYYTPVNEPLTTARFSGLYGLWYPHHKSEYSFYKMLLNQLKGTLLAMEAIRSVNPSAKLVQTEDLGKTHSTAALAYQANFENDRRLLTFDILTGRLKADHPQYEYLLGCGIRKDELEFFEQPRLRPDILGLNYYVTSERWLDESLEKYQPNTHGGNGRHQYADTEIVRVADQKRSGLRDLATEIWNRYHIPLAITEAHLHCTREEQLRWFMEIWNDSVALAQNGIDLRGVTAWALLGSFDWDTLLTKTGTQYESGVFDIKTFPEEIRPTALAELITTIARDQQNFHPVLSQRGWWHWDDKFKNDSPEIIILGADGKDKTAAVVKKLANGFSLACNQRRIASQVAASLTDIRLTGKLWAIIDVSGIHKQASAFCNDNNIQFVTFYREDSITNGLQILAEQMPLSGHQINKVLDLMIDGEEGSWIFDEGGIIFKAETLLNRH